MNDARTITKENVLRYFVENDFRLSLEKVEGGEIVGVIRKDDLHCAFTLTDPVARAFLTAFVIPAITSVVDTIERNKT